MLLLKNYCTEVNILTLDDLVMLHRSGILALSHEINVFMKDEVGGLRKRVAESWDSRTTPRRYVFKTVTDVPSAPANIITLLQKSTRSWRKSMFTASFVIKPA